MPAITNSDRPASRPSTRATTSPSASVTRRTRAAKVSGGENVASTGPKKGRVVRRADPVPVQESEAASTAPANIRALSKRNVMTVCDSVSVAGRFGSQSRCSAVAPDTTVWTGEADGSIVIRLAPSGMEVSRIQATGRAVVLVLANVSGRMWAGYSDGAIRVFDHDTQKVLRESTQHTAAVYAMCAADGFVYTGGADWKVYQWEADDLHFCRMYHGHRNNVRCLTTYKDPESGCRYVVSGSDDGTVKVWDTSVAVSPMKKAACGANAEKDAGCVATLDGQGRGVRSALVLEDTAELWVGSEDTAIRVWDLYSMTITSVITAHRTPVVTMQRVEETVWSGSKDGTIVITNRFSKDVVHQATQPPTSSSSGGLQQRFNMSIQPVTRTVIYNVWATSADGSWQCWNFTAPESGAPYTEDEAAVTYPEGHYLSQSRNRRSPHTSQRRSSSARATSAATADAHHNSHQSSTMREDDAELRESVARTRRSVAELLTEPAEVTLNNGRGAAAASADVDAEAQDEDDVPLEVVAESIRNDRAEATKKDVEHQLAALEKEMKRAEKLREQLRKLGQDPVAVAAAATVHNRAPRKSVVADSPSTEALENVSSKLDAQRVENAALAAAINAAKK
jgi:hypothetical protein